MDKNKVINHGNTNKQKERESERKTVNIKLMS